jgi:hypothetical protein
MSTSLAGNAPDRLMHATVSPRRASSRAAAAPSPLLAPVTTTPPRRTALTGQPRRTQSRGVWRSRQLPEHVLGCRSVSGSTSRTSSGVCRGNSNTSTACWDPYSGPLCALWSSAIRRSRPPRLRHVGNERRNYDHSSDSVRRKNFTARASSRLALKAWRTEAIVA